MKKMFSTLKGAVDTAREQVTPELESLSIPLVDVSSLAKATTDTVSEAIQVVPDLPGRLGGGATDALEQARAMYDRATTPESLRDTARRVTEAAPGVPQEVLEHGDSLQSMWSVVAAAVTNDAFVQDITDWAAEFATDYARESGVEEKIAQIDGLLEQVGLSGPALREAIPIEPVQIVANAVPAIAVLLNWNDEQRETLAELGGSLAVSGVFSLSPLGMIVALVALARVVHQAGNDDVETDWREIGTAVGKGGALSALVMGTGTVLAGPLWFAFVAGVVVVMLSRGVVVPSDLGDLAKAMWDARGSLRKG